jgi:arylformamidase
MRIIDVTAPLREGMPAWPGDTPFARRERLSLERGDADTVSELVLSAHTGTHIDAPSHLLREGGSMGSVPLDVLVGDALVVDLTHLDRTIGADDLERANVPVETTRLLAKTTNSGWSRPGDPFREEFVAFDESGAHWCLERGVRLLGIDYLSIEPFGRGREGHPVHLALLEAGVAILEGLDLADADPGPYRLVALPLAITDAEGAPARVVLLE